MKYEHCRVTRADEARRISNPVKRSTHKKKKITHKADRRTHAKRHISVQGEVEHMMGGMQARVLYGRARKESRGREF